MRHLGKQSNPSTCGAHLQPLRPKTVRYLEKQFRRRFSLSCQRTLPGIRKRTLMNLAFIVCHIRLFVSQRTEYHVNPSRFADLITINLQDF